MKWNTRDVGSSSALCTVFRHTDTSIMLVLFRKVVSFELPNDNM